MALKGDLKSISLASLLQMIEGERKTGYLNVDSGKYARRLFLKDGKMISLVSTDPNDLLGHFLVSRGFVTEQQLAQAMSKQSETKALLGKILAPMAQISEAKLQEQLQQKMQESFFQLFLLEEAAFEFVDEAIDLAAYAGVTPLGLTNLLMEGTRRLDEYKRLKQVFPDPNQTFNVHRENIGTAPVAQGSVQKLLELLESGATIEDLCLNFHTYDHTIFHYLEPLFKRQVITKGAVRKPAAAKENLKAAGVLMELAQRAETSKDWLKASEIYADLLKLEPTNKAFSDPLKFVQLKASEQIFSGTLKKDTVLAMKEGVDFSKLKLSPQDGFVLSRINGQWKVSEILSVVPMPEAEALAILQNLLSQGILVSKP